MSSINQKRWVVIINKDARQGESLLSDLTAAVKASALPITDIYTVAPSEFQTTLQQVLARGVDVVLVGGGDGTITVAVRTLTGTSVALAVLPLGTTNNFARSLGLPLDPIALLPLYATATTQEVSVAAVNNIMFANAATIGVSVATAATVQPQHKRWFGRLAYLFIAARFFFTRRSFRCEIQANGQTQKFWTHQLVIANGSHHAGRPLPTDASLAKPHVTITAFGTSASRLQHLKNLFLFAWGAMWQPKGELAITASSARIITHPKKGVEADGEIATTTPAQITIVPQQLKVLIPQEASDINN